MGKNKKDSVAKAKQQYPKSNEDFIWVDPIWIRFQHSRIRPSFSSCGRTLLDTLNSIRNGDITPFDLPPIQVLVGPETETGRWYFSLNNRRLWVLKRCREEGLLVNSNNCIPVRVRAPKSQAEVERYTLEKCSVEAKVMREKTKDASVAMNNETNGALKCHEDAVVASIDAFEITENARISVSVDDDDETEMYNGCCNRTNRFSDLS